MYALLNETITPSPHLEGEQDAVVLPFPGAAKDAEGVMWDILGYSDDNPASPAPNPSALDEIAAVIEAHLGYDVLADARRWQVAIEASDDDLAEGRTSVFESTEDFLNHLDSLGGDDHD